MTPFPDQVSLTSHQNLTANENIDDEDGHYRVTEDMPIGDRCRFILHFRP